jgi:dihydrofolate reductase
MRKVIGGAFISLDGVVQARRVLAFHAPRQPHRGKVRQAQKYVLTRSDPRLDWQGSHRLADLDALAKVKAGDGPDLVIQGSSTIYPQLLTRGLLDRLVLMIGPVTLGGGKRLFGDGVPAGTFKLIEHRLTAGGWAMASYEPAGPLKTGSIPMPEPSEAERRRRTRMEAGDW